MGIDIIGPTIIGLLPTAVGPLFPIGASAQVDQLSRGERGRTNNACLVLTEATVIYHSHHVDVDRCQSPRQLKLTSVSPSTSTNERSHEGALRSLSGLHNANTDTEGRIIIAQLLYTITTLNWTSLSVDYPLSVSPQPAAQVKAGGADYITLWKHIHRGAHRYPTPPLLLPQWTPRLLATTPSTQRMRRVSSSLDRHRDGTWLLNHVTTTKPTQ